VLLLAGLLATLDVAPSPEPHPAPSILLARQQLVAAHPLLCLLLQCLPAQAVPAALLAAALHAAAQLHPAQHCQKAARCCQLLLLLLLLLPHLEC
jgi:hypothetical protein